MQKLPRRALAALLLVCCLVGCQAPPAPPAQPPQRAEAVGSFTLSFLTIGKGDAFLLETPAGEFYLVDTGKLEDYLQIARLLRVKGVNALAGILLTHGHRDHAGCLDALLAAFPTRRVYLSGADTVSYTQIDARAITQAHGVALHALSCGEQLDWGGVTAEVWLATQPDPVNENNNSVVLRIPHGDNAFLLMGDAEHGAEQALLASGMALQADVLKLGHHGEADATSPALLDRVRPTYAIIAGNAAENPDSVNETITGYLKARDIAPYYAACDGLAVDFVSDGHAITVATVADRALARTVSLSFVAVHRKAQWVSLRNDGAETADLTGCLLVSEKSGAVYRFPDGTKLAAGGVLTVACRDSSHPGDLTWDADSVWHKKNDRARLYDSNCNLLAENIASQGGS